MKGRIILTIEEAADERGDYLVVTAPRGVFCLDAIDRPVLESAPWYVNWYGHNFYVGATVGGVMILLHRVIMKATPNIQIDHRDGNGLNCRRYNMRPATGAQNRMSRPNARRGKSGLKGVHQISAISWSAMISLGKRNKQKNLGTFCDPISAALAYDAAARELRGEFAVTNFPLPSGVNNS